jgi:Zn-finger nucleic acid-binding protein
VSSSIQSVVAERTRPLVVPQGGSEEARRRTIAPARVAYRPCCDCGKIMNRVNFARSSGIVLDACKGHGVWCDAEELRQVVEFVRSGGLETAKRREDERLQLERSRQQFARKLEATEDQGHRPMRSKLHEVDETDDSPVLSLVLSLFAR